MLGSDASARRFARRRGMSRRVRHPVSRDIAARRRARLSPPSRRRPTRPTRVLLRVHEVRRRGPADRTKARFPGVSTQGIRPVKQIDEHDLFRLYNASTPSRARFALGMTADQWRAARERAGWRSREYVFRQDGAARGWVQITRRGRSAILTLMSHPSADDSIPALVTHAMSRSWGVKNWYVLVGDHQGRLGSLMRQRGFQEAARYVTMSRAITSPVTIAEASRAVRLAGLNPAVDLSERWQSSTREESYAARNT